MTAWLSEKRLCWSSPSPGLSFVLFSFVYHHLSFITIYPFSRYLRGSSLTFRYHLKPHPAVSELCCPVLLIYKPSKDLNENAGVFVVRSERPVGAGEGTKQSCKVWSGAVPAWGAVPGISARVTDLASQTWHHRCLHTGLALALLFSSHIIEQRPCLPHLGFISI